MLDGLWATKSKGVGLIVRAISFQNFASYVVLIHQRHTDRQTERQTDDMWLHHVVIISAWIPQYYYYHLYFNKCILKKVVSDDEKHVLNSTATLSLSSSVIISVIAGITVHVWLCKMLKCSQLKKLLLCAMYI